MILLAGIYYPEGYRTSSAADGEHMVPLDRTRCQWQPVRLVALTNDTQGAAADVGVGPGVHLDLLSIHDSTDEDWYQFELILADDLDVELM